MLFHCILIDLKNFNHFPWFELAFFVLPICVQMFVLLHHLKQLKDAQLARNIKVSSDHSEAEEFDAAVMK